MQRAWLGRRLCFAWVTAVAVLAAGAPSSALEAFEGRVQAHGFFETQIRAISGNYNQDWDLTQC